MLLTSILCVPLLVGLLCLVARPRALLETLNILEGFPMHDMKQGSAPSLHVVIEAMKRAYADRARYLDRMFFVVQSGQHTHELAQKHISRSEQKV